MEEDDVHNALPNGLEKTSEFQFSFSITYPPNTKISIRILKKTIELYRLYHDGFVLMICDNERAA